MTLSLRIPALALALVLLALLIGHAVGVAGLFDTLLATLGGAA